MRNVVRSPLAWMVAAEVVVVALLLAVAWQLVAGGRPAAALPVVVPGPAASDPADPGLPRLDVPVVAPSPGPGPGLNVAAGFWRARLGDLNREQALFVQLEWRLVGAAEAAVRRYLETAVLPAVRRAERARR